MNSSDIYQNRSQNEKRKFNHDILYLQEDRARKMEALHQCFYFFVWVFRLYLLSYCFLTIYCSFPIFCCSTFKRLIITLSFFPLEMNWENMQLSKLETNYTKSCSEVSYRIAFFLISAKSQEITCCGVWFSKVQALIPQFC